MTYVWKSFPEQSPDLLCYIHPLHHPYRSTSLMTPSKNCLHCRNCSIVPLGTGDVIACHENPKGPDHRFSIPIKDAESHSCENYESVSLRKFILTKPQLDALYKAISTAIFSDRLFDTYELGIDTEDSEAYVAGCEWQ